MRRAGALLAGCLLLAACTGPAGEGPSDGGGAAPRPTPSATKTLDPASAAACGEFWGDPDYIAPLSRDVLDRAATAPDQGPDDPGFYASTGDDIDTAFASAAPEVRAELEPLAEWFRTQPEKGSDADKGAFREAWKRAGSACAEVSPAAAWSVAPGKDGTKPAALVCADITDTPSTLLSFANANVLTSNMFKIVGLYPLTVPKNRMDDIRATDELLARQIAAVDDDAVREALTSIREPFQDALNGDRHSPGLQDPLRELGSACSKAGYEIPSMDEGGSGGDTGGDGLV